MKYVVISFIFFFVLAVSMMALTTAGDYWHNRRIKKDYEGSLRRRDQDFKR